MTRRAIVTGVTGFVGGRLVERLLADGWQVTAIVRSSSDTAGLANEGLALHVHDGGVAPLTDLIERVRPDIVFHLASLFLADHRPDQIPALVASNVLFPLELVESMTLARIDGPARLVTAGTNWQHFGTTDYRPVNLYAATKQAFDALLAYYNDARHLSAITLKLYDTYGHGDPRRKLLAILRDAARQGDALSMTPGDQWLELTHIDDVVDAFVQAASLLVDAASPLNAHYLVPGDRLTLKQLVALVGEIAGRPLAVEFGGRPYREREVMTPVVADATTALPGWAPRRRLASSLPDYLR